MFLSKPKEHYTCLQTIACPRMGWTTAVDQAVYYMLRLACGFLITWNIGVGVIESIILTHWCLATHIHYANQRSFFEKNICTIVVNKMSAILFKHKCEVRVCIFMYFLINNIVNRSEETDIQFYLIILIQRYRIGWQIFYYDLAVLP